MPKISWKHIPLMLSVALVSPGAAQADAPDSYSADEPVVAASYSGDLDGFRPLRLSEWPVPQADDETQLIAALQSAFLEDGGPTPSLLISRRDDRLIIDVERTGFEDDSVSGSLTRGVFRSDAEGGLRLFDAGIKFQCARGANAGSFTDQLCP